MDVNELGDLLSLCREALYEGIAAYFISVLANIAHVLGPTYVFLTLHFIKKI